MDLWNRTDINYQEKQRMHNEQLDIEKTELERQKAQDEKLISEGKAQMAQEKLLNDQLELERKEKEKAHNEQIINEQQKRRAQEDEKLNAEILFREKQEAERIKSERAKLLTPEQEAEIRLLDNLDFRHQYKDAYRKYQAAVAYGEFERVPAIKEFMDCLDNKVWAVLDKVPPQLKYFLGEITFVESGLIKLL